MGRTVPAMANMGTFYTLLKALWKSAMSQHRTPQSFLAWCCVWLGRFWSYEPWLICIWDLGVSVPSVFLSYPQVQHTSLSANSLGELRATLPCHQNWTAPLKQIPKGKLDDLFLSSEWENIGQRPGTQCARRERERDRKRRKCVQSQQNWGTAWTTDAMEA
jgi:hypothetical protein